MSEMNNTTQLDNIEFHSKNKQNDEKDEFLEFLYAPAEIEISSDAQKKLGNLLKSLPPESYLRIEFDSKTNQVTIRIDEKTDTDRIITCGTIEFLMDPISVQVFSSLQINLGSASTEFDIMYSLRQSFKTGATCLTDGNCCSGSDCC